MKTRRGSMLSGILCALVVAVLAMFGAVKATNHQLSTKQVAVVEAGVPIPVVTVKAIPVVKKPTVESIEPAADPDESALDEYNSAHPQTEAEMKAEEESYRRKYPEQAAEQDFRDSLNGSLAKLNDIAKSDKAALAAKSKTADPKAPVYRFTPQGSPRMAGDWGQNYAAGTALHKITFMTYHFQLNGEFAKDGHLLNRPVKDIGIYRLDGNTLTLGFTYTWVNGKRYTSQPQQLTLKVERDTNGEESFFALTTHFTKGFTESRYEETAPASTVVTKTAPVIVDKGVKMPGNDLAVLSEKLNLEHDHFAVDAEIDFLDDTIYTVTVTPFVNQSAHYDFGIARIHKLRAQYVAEARAWLKKIGVPAGVRIIVDAPGY